MQEYAVVELFFLLLFLLWKAVDLWISPLEECFPTWPRGKIEREAEVMSPVVSLRPS